MIITYLIKSTLCLAVLFGFYKIALESKALHHFKRFYLLVSLVFSLTIPLVTFTYTTSQIPEEVWVEDFAQAWETQTINAPVVIETNKTNYLPYILWSIYGVGFLFFGGRFLLNLVRLKRKITAAETHDHQDFILALLSQSIIPHSFLKYIFLSRKRYEDKEIPSEVMAHEATHVRQKHSLDILFIEFLQVVFWFNPLFWITKKSITLNHEFLADQGAIDQEHDIYKYQHILLNYAGSNHHTVLESPFNYSSTKKRILMLSQSFSRKRAALSALILIPIIVLCAFLFNDQIIAQSKDTNKLDYAENFMNGAERNGKKALVIELKNNSLQLNGKASSIATLREDIDAITQDWKETDYTTALPSFLFKNNATEFLKKANIEFLKTKYAEANEDMDLLPLAPPTPPSPNEDLPPPPPPPNVEDHLFKMNRLGSLFYFENKEVSYKKAQKIIKKNSSLNVNTPYPYTNPPQTFISKESIDIQEESKGFKKGDTITFTLTDTGEKRKAIYGAPIPKDIDPSTLKEYYNWLNKTFPNEKKPSQTSTIRKGDTLTVTVTDTGEKAYAIMDDEKIGTIIDKKPEDAGIGRKELDTYGRLAKKYNTNPKGKILQKEVILMEDIYARMNSEQKKKAEPFPNIPPPPTPLKPFKKTKVDSPRVLNIAQKEAIKQTFTPVSLQQTAIPYTPGQSIKPISFDETEVSDGQLTFNSSKDEFYENGKRLSFNEGISKWTSGNYSVASKQSIEGSLKNGIELLKKKILP